MVSKQLDRAEIKYLKRTIEESNVHKLPDKGEITLSTIHAIKGLEAEYVYLIGANQRNHPCRASEHPLMETVKIDDPYDSYDEEIRLLYVALTRAKTKVIINYTGSLTQFLTKNNAPKKEYKAHIVDRLESELKSWRLDCSREHNILPYQVFNDRTLKELCAVQPLDVQELHAINGFGSYKVNRWGRKIVEIVREFG